MGSLGRHASGGRCNSPAGGAGANAYRLAARVPGGVTTGPVLLAIGLLLVHVRGGPPPGAPPDDAQARTVPNG